MPHELRALTCPTCTGPLDATETADGVVRCNYCGTSVRVAPPGAVAPTPAPEPEGRERLVVPFTQPWDVVRDAVVAQARRTRRGVPGAEPTVDKLLVPAWVARGRVTSSWRVEVPKRSASGVSWSSERDSLAKTWEEICVLGADGPWGEVAQAAAGRSLKAVPMTESALADTMIVDNATTVREARATARSILQVLQEDEITALLPRGATDLVVSTSVDEVEVEAMLLPVWAVSIPRREGPAIRGWLDDIALELITDAPATPVRRPRRRGGGGGGVIFWLGCAFFLVALAAAGGFALLVLLLVLVEG